PMQYIVVAALIGLLIQVAKRRVKLQGAMIKLPNQAKLDFYQAEIDAHLTELEVELEKMKNEDLAPYGHASRRIRGIARKTEMKFNEWFDLWDQTEDPKIRRLCETAYDVGYDQSKKDAQFEQVGRCVHGVPVTDFCREFCG